MHPHQIPYMTEALLIISVRNSRGDGSEGYIPCIGDTSNYAYMNGDSYPHWNRLEHMVLVFGHVILDWHLPVALEGVNPLWDACLHHYV